MSVISQLRIALGQGYDIRTGSDLLYHADTIDYLQQLNRPLAVITDTYLASWLTTPWVAYLQQQGLRVELLTVPRSEAAKTRAVKASIEDQLFARGLGRDCALCAVGGGAVTDLSGFIAATFCRGVPVIYFPTTLLAMVDASIGGKTAINVPAGKNLLGCFYQPHTVFCDIACLSHLSAPAWRDGFAEMLKHGLLFDADYVARLTAAPIASQGDSLVELISRSCELKRSVIETDEREAGVRAVLNFGHTIGHAIEAASQFQVSHGAAVALGMWLETCLAASLGLADVALAQQISQQLAAQDFVLQLPCSLTALLPYLLADKKNREGLVHFVFIAAAGQVYRPSRGYTVGLPLDEIGARLADFV